MDTVFRIGSSSKAVTSVAMGVLIDDGAVDLDAPMSTYVPDISEPLSPITTRQAMSHTAGVRDYGLCLCFPIWPVRQPQALQFPTSTRCGRLSDPRFCLRGRGLFLHQLRVQRCRCRPRGA